MKNLALVALLGCACAATPPSSDDAGTSQTNPEAGDVLSNPTFEVSPNGVIPACDSARMCTFTWGSYVLGVDANHGARIVKFSLSGQNILVTQAAGAAQFGATFWPSPQTLWNWPPIATIDTSAYSVSVQGDVLVLTSSSFTITTGAPTMTIEKHLAVNSANNVVSITYGFINQGNTSVSLAPWEITGSPLEGSRSSPTPTADRRRGRAAELLLCRQPPISNPTHSLPTSPPRVRPSSAPPAAAKATKHTFRGICSWCKRGRMFPHQKMRSAKVRLNSIPTRVLPTRKSRTRERTRPLALAIEPIGPCAGRSPPSPARMVVLAHRT
jgi:hypothetical protein